MYHKSITVCSVDDCGRPIHTHTYHLCLMHYKRMKRSGYLKPPTIAERFWSKVNRSGGRDACWLWQAGLGTGGYGQFAPEHKSVLAHRVAYELTIGPIPEGQTLDHRCRTKICMNPTHLEIVTRAENRRRAWRSPIPPEPAWVNYAIPKETEPIQPQVGCKAYGCSKPIYEPGLGFYRRHFWSCGKAEDLPYLVRFWSRVDQDGPVPEHRPELGPCWVWLTTKNNDGYGQFTSNIPGKVNEVAHRIAYRLTYGAIPEGLIIDHLCSNRICIRPEHLQAVTQAENLRRCPTTSAKQNAAKTHCPKGHLYDDTNTIHRKDKRGRQCRICLYAAVRRYQDRKRSHNNST